MVRSAEVFRAEPRALTGIQAQNDGDHRKEKCLSKFAKRLTRVDFQNSLQFSTTRCTHVSLTQMILHFSCTHCAPQTGHRIPVFSPSNLRSFPVMSSEVETSLSIRDPLVSVRDSSTSLRMTSGHDRALCLTTETLTIQRSTTALQSILKIINRFADAFVEFDLWFPPKNFFCARNVGLPHFRIVHR
jgi:hypothetical protein